MTREQQDAVAQLVAVLAEENAALEALDYRRVGDFIDRKRAALDALNASLPASSDQVPTAQDPSRKAMAVRLKQLLGENRELLRRAIKVQNRIMGVVASAARQAQAPVGYGARGNRPRSSAANAVALIVRA